MCTRDPGASFDTPNVVIGRQGRNELTLSFRPDPYLATLLLVQGLGLDSRRSPICCPVSGSCPELSGAVRCWPVGAGPLAVG